MPDEVMNFGHDWHVDVTFREEPSLGAVLHTIETPPAGGIPRFGTALRGGRPCRVPDLLRSSALPGDGLGPSLGAP